MPSRSALCRSPFAPALIAALALAPLGCGAGGGGSGGAGGSVTPGTSGPGGQGGSGATAISRAHTTLALAALGGPSGYVPATVEAKQSGLDVWNRHLARSWPEIRKLIDPGLEQSIRDEIAKLAPGGQGGMAIAVRSITIDTTAPLGFAGSGAGTAQRFAVQLPVQPGAWRILVDVTASQTLHLNVFGVSIPTTIVLEATAEVSDIRIEQGVRLDASSAARPLIAGTEAPRVNMTLRLDSQSPLLSQIAPALTSVLDPAIRIALPVGAIFAQREIAATFRAVPGFWQPYGTGAAPAQPVTGTIDLEAVSNEFSELIQRELMPFDTVLPAEYSQPGFGNGTIVHFDDYGDSPCWTGHYVMGEAMRFDVTGSPHAEAGINRALGGLLNCLEVTKPGDGWLSRIAIPMSHPEAARIGYGHYQGLINGVPHAAIGNISRDQYQGTLLGAVHAFQRVPSARPRAREIVSRMLDFCERSDWVVFEGPGSTTMSVSSPMSQAMGFVWAFLMGGNLVDPAKYGASHANAAACTSVLWFDTWSSSREMLEEYYKFSLGHDNQSILFSLETDPARYRDYAKQAEIFRDVIGHHDNAWFDVVHGAAIPARTATMGPRVRTALERWTLRPRRGFQTDLRNDPTIPKAWYTSPMYTSGTVLFATEVVPIEKRVNGDFVWQQKPFELTGGNGPGRQYPGIDMILPYWLGRAYGMVR